MLRRKTKCFVIDTSVVRSCGGKDATHPCAMRCREFLLAIYRVCHRIILSDKIWDEWCQHKSGFAHQWLHWMHGRKKKVERLFLASGDVLRHRLNHLGFAEKDLRILEKDLHLIEAARVSDGIIASRDNEVRGVLQQAAKIVPELRDIVWVNPEEDLTLCNWLAVGAPRQKHRLLGHSCP